MAHFADYTNNIVQKLPYWFKMKKNPYDSIGPLFLNAFGLEMEDVKYILEYAYEQTRIGNVDVDYLDTIYKVILPTNIDMKKVLSVSTNHILLKEVYDLTEFFNITYNKNDYTDNDVYLYDPKRNVVFVRKQYDICNHYKNGKLIITDEKGKIELPIVTHNVWNFLDEFGLLLSCNRLEGESNINYKNRILDVFENPGNSSKDGLLNAISRELNLRKNIVWQDCSKDLVINDQMVVVNKIQVNGRYISTDEVFVDEYNRIVLKGDYELTEVTKNVSYVCGIEMHSFNNKDDKKMNYEFFYSDGKPKELLLKYVQKMHEDMPIIWGKFKWDNAYWDITDEQLGGLAYIPSNYDASIKGFVDYKK